jgi:competence protein ComGC
MNKATEQVEVKEQVKDYGLDKFNTTSAKIRHLNSQGLTRSEISKVLNIRYQHVRNVLIQPLKRPQ